jgi:ABC-2 type transport system ATP-binding protein
VRRVLGLVVANAAWIGLLCCSTAAQARDAVVMSFDGTPIVTHFYSPAGLAAGERVPTVLYGSGYGYRGPNTPDAGGGVRLGQGDYRSEGYNVLTWDARGFGGSGGTSMFDSPAFEARDVQALIDWVATQPEALLDAPGDPRVAMVGASYGGGIQLVTAAIEPRVDALVPDAAWHSLVTGFARDNAFKAGWLAQLCALGVGFGLLDGVTDGVSGPAGIQIGSVDSRFATMCAEGTALGRLSAATTQWLASIGPGALVSSIRAPTLLMQGTVDTLLPLGEAIANYKLLRASGVPVKMLWYCGGHGTCLTPTGDTGVLRAAAMSWLRRWLKRDASVDTGAPFEWVDDGGTWRAGPDYPLAAAGALATAGSGSLTVSPTVTATAGTTTISTPLLAMVESRYASPAADSDIVGEPTLSLTYRGVALPSSTFLYAQVVDVVAGRVVGNQVTPVPVVLDGLTHTVTRMLEAVALRGRPSSDLRLQIVGATPVYGPQRSAGSVTLSAITSALPVVDAAGLAARATAAAPFPAATAPSASDPRVAPRRDTLGAGLLDRPWTLLSARSRAPQRVTRESAIGDQAARRAASRARPGVG